MEASPLRCALSTPFGTFGNLHDIADVGAVLTHVAGQTEQVWNPTWPLENPEIHTENTDWSDEMS